MRRLHTMVGLATLLCAISCVVVGLVSLPLIARAQFADVGGFWAPPIGTPVHLGTNGDGQNNSLTTIAAAPAGSLVFVGGIIDPGGQTLLSCADSSSNSWTVVNGNLVGGQPLVSYCVSMLSNSIASGGTITYNINGANGTVITAIDITGIRSKLADKTGSYQTGNGTSASASTTGTLSQNREIAIGVVGLDNSSSAFVPGSGWTSIGTGGSGGAGTLWMAWQRLLSTSSVTFAPTWTTARLYENVVVSFPGY